MTEETLALIDRQCEADGIPREGCGCHRDVFRETVLERAKTPEAARLAAMMQAADAIDQMEMAKILQEAGRQTLNEAAQLLIAAQRGLEGCDDAAEEAQRKAERAVDLPEGDDPKTRFVRNCAAKNGRVGVCTCVADALLENLSPLELELMVDLQDADARGDDAMASLAEERGMTVEEAEKGLMMMSGRISAAMMAINPMACAMVAR
ncbi:hypothetical protein M8744_15790 [Lutimaribacter sp. EGI FJ00013]|uniref:Uncharacterized protein n=1 Tax=Lutimaribacter degradans TaxID=2945989 RepID=A0ACC5ZZ25_9RHOB|nr:hypothetical protein [Lutimaribacter sp. EGI FJ00013]MCM2563618.1 hypothetical protein [Lutimaribacter sp. EGI FJ00013]